MSGWRLLSMAAILVLASTPCTVAQVDSCTLRYEAYGGGTPAEVPDASGELQLAFHGSATDEISHTDPEDQVIPPFAPPGGWFVALSNPDDGDSFWAREDSRMLDPSPGTEASFHVLLHPRHAETGIDSVHLGWGGPCFSPPNVTVLSMSACDSSATLVEDMRMTSEVGLGKSTTPVWHDDAFCVAVGTSDELLASVQLILQGPFNSGNMTVSSLFSSAVPLTPPYSDARYDGTPLDFDQAVSVTVLPEGTVDWLLVSLRSDTSATSEVAASVHAVVLLHDGTVVEPDGSTLRFPGVAADDYYLVARHRNHLDVMSSDRLEMTDGVGSWDFTIGLSQAYTTGPSPMASLGSGVFGLYAGDGSVDKQTTAPDFNLWSAATSAGETGYRQSDYNLDGLVTAPDFNLWSANTSKGATSTVPD